MVADRFVRGSGTSQAAAVTSGAVALLLQKRPTLTPDQVKMLLRFTAKHLDRADALGRGEGLLDIKKAAGERVPSLNASVQPYPMATGLGSLEAACGSAHVFDGDSELSGEQDIFGDLWDGRRWSGEVWTTDSFNGRRWSANLYT